MGAARVGVICEGPIDRALLAALLERIARDRAGFAWPTSTDDIADSFRIRERGHGRVVEAVKRLIEVLSRSPCRSEAFYVVVLDRRTRPAHKAVRKLLRGRGQFIFGTAIEEIEAWWLADRRSTLGWAGLDDPLPRDMRYSKAHYVAERDQDPKRTLDEVTEQSPKLDCRYGRNGNLGLAEDFADTWRQTAKLADVEAQCPRGFGPFCRAVSREFTRAGKRL